MAKLKIISGVVLIFILGAISGALGTYIFYETRVEPYKKGGHERRHEVIMKRLSRQLDLDREQYDQVGAVMQEISSEIRLVRAQYRPQIETILEQGQEKIRKILRPEQREKYEKIIAKYKGRSKKREP